MPCLDVRDGVVVKGVQFRNHKVMGDILELAARYAADGADELVFYDITASPDRRSVDREWVASVARLLDIPFCVAGGIRSVADAEEVLNRGADKISINSPALQDPSLIETLAARFGSQCVVVGVDTFEHEGRYEVHQLTGDPNKSHSTARSTIDWVREAEQRGAGEIVLNCMNQDGVKRGYDINQLSQVRSVLTIPLVASGGAGAVEHFAEVFAAGVADAALAASVFHSGAIRIPDLKRALIAQGLPIRPNIGST